MSELFPEQIPEPVRDEITALYRPALTALETALNADKAVRFDLDCPHCGKRFRKTKSIPEMKARLDAARFVAEQAIGRAAPKPPEKDEAEEKITVFRNVVAAPDRGDEDQAAAVELVLELASAVIAGSLDDAQRIAERVYERLPSRAEGG